MKMTVALAALAFAFAANASTPKESCEKLVEAAKANKFEDFLALTTNYQANKSAGDKKFNKMHATFMEKIKAINCKEERIGGTHAIVEASSGDETRFIPFVNVNDTWKFDAKTYMTFYAPAGKSKVAKGM